MYMTSATAKEIKFETKNEIDNYIEVKHNTRNENKAHHKNMIKQKLSGLVLVLCGVVPILVEGDATALVFLAMFFLPMIFSKQYIMTFKE